MRFVPMQQNLTDDQNETILKLLNERFNMSDINNSRITIVLHKQNEILYSSNGPYNTPSVPLPDDVKICKMSVGIRVEDPRYREIDIKINGKLRCRTIMSSDFPIGEYILI